MSAVDQGIILNKYNLSQRRNNGFMPISQQFINFNKRTRRSSNSKRKLPNPDACELTKARRRELIQRGIPLMFGFVISAVMVTYGVGWLLS
jgi:hypothetical protein